MRLKLRNHLRILAALLIATLFYDEFVIYWVKSLKWPRIECQNSGDDCLKLLLVADPQILGRHEESGMLDRVFVWDSNRYLTKTYRRALQYFDPDAVFFLGDLTYDGRISTAREFERNVETLSFIFGADFSLPNVWLAGDNDVGGENEPIYPDKVRRFNGAFRQADHVRVKRTIVYNANGLFQIMPKRSPDHGKNFTKVVLSHMPLLLSPGKYTEAVFTQLEPSVIFSGHKHTAYHLETTLNAMFVSKVVAMTSHDTDSIIKFQLKEDTYHEFVVPTCSYRMGVPNMGYGIAIIENSKYVTYTILWSPKRFEQLFVYLILSFVLTVYILLIIVFKLMSALCQSTIQYIKV